MTKQTRGDLISLLLELKEEQVLGLVVEQLAASVPPHEILDQMRQAMIEVGERFAAGTYFISEMIMAAEIFRMAMEKIEPHLADEATAQLGEVVFATVRGDIHDLGKNIVVTMLRGAGFHVHDLGVDVPPERIIEVLQETGARVLWLSGLITTAFDSMRDTVNALEQASMRDQVKVIIGGVLENEVVQAYTGADAWGKDPRDAIAFCRRFVEGH